MVIHVVKPGDTIYAISQRYGVNPNKIISDNGIGYNLIPGQSIVINTPFQYHTVKSGESLYSIAKKYNISIDDIISSNPSLNNNNLIYPGQTLVIKPKKLGSIEVNGYAYPTTKMEVLNKTLKYLTYLSIFSYEVNINGTLDLIDDEPLIDAALDQGVAPVMVITNKEFSSYVASELLNNNEVQTTLINNIVYLLKTKNYYALNIDFEYLYPRDKNAYKEFLERITDLLKPLGYPVFTALAPKIEENQKGILYEAHDYKAHGELVDRIILMTYEWGYTYGPPMAVAPVSEIKKVLNYATTVIPTEKILMGMPNYGYDWTLPWMQGNSASALSNVLALNRAISAGTFIKYDEKAKAPYYNYYDSNKKLHVVWFEDARSIREKLLLVDIYDLAGVSYWTIGSYFPQNWIILDSMYDIIKIDLQ